MAKTRVLLLKTLSLLSIPSQANNKPFTCIVSMNYTHSHASSDGVFSIVICKPPNYYYLINFADANWRMEEYPCHFHIAFYSRQWKSTALPLIRPL